jgi:hypothetical protein
VADAGEEREEVRINEAMIYHGANLVVRAGVAKREKSARDLPTPPAVGAYCQGQLLFCASMGKSP